MNIARPTLAELVARIQTDLESRLLDGNSALRRSTIAVLARVWAGELEAQYAYLSWLAKQPFADSAESEYLERLAAVWGVSRKSAAAAAGAALFTGAAGATIAAGTELSRPDGALYATAAAAAMPAAGTLALTVTARAAGAEGDAAAGTALTLTSPVDGISGSATVAAGGLTGGADAETDAGLRARLLARIQNTPQGGSAEDYVAWALAVPGVTRAWAYPRHLGAGTVGVAVVNDAAAATPIPDAALVASVQAYIEARRPVTAAVTVFAPQALAVDVALTVSPNTAAVRAAVTAELRDLFAREAEPGGVIRLSHLNEAVSVAGEEDHAIAAPAADVTPAAMQFPVLGTVTFA